MEKKQGHAKQGVAFLKGYCHHWKLWLGGLLLLFWIAASVATAAAAEEYDASAVDTPPKIVRQMPVTYPPQAKKDKVTGRVVVRVLIGTDGKAAKMEIAESEPAGIFDESALASLKNWQFRPGIKGGQLVGTWVKIPLKFELQ